MQDFGYIGYLISKSQYLLKNRKLKEGFELENLLFIPDNYLSLLKYLSKDKNTIIIYQKQLKKFKKYYEKLWKKQDLTDKNLLIFKYSCGLGDYIMYSRYIRILQSLAGKVIIESYNTLYDLYKYNFPECDVVDYVDELIAESYDYTFHHELFCKLQKDDKKMYMSEGYLNVDPELVKKYSVHFNTEKKKVGFFIPDEKKDERSLPIDKMIPVFENQKFQFYSLTIDNIPSDADWLQKKYNIVNLMPYIKNANDTAALMKNMDLVISTDSFPIHLAGALGVKSYLLLNHNNDWRWFNDTETTSWYDSVRIFKQKQPDNWDDVINEIVTSMEKEF